MRGHPGDSPPTVGELAGYLLLKPHSTVELINRAETAGLVRRSRDDGDGRVIRVRLTTEGESRLSQLSTASLDELRRLAPALSHLATGETESG